MRCARRRGGEGRAAFSETRRGAFAFGTTTSVGSKFRASTMFTELGSMLLAKWGARSRRPQTEQTERSCTQIG